MKISVKQNPSSNFNLKNEVVDLVGHRVGAAIVHVSLRDLERMRAERAFIPASRHGVETICGASCETGAT